MNIIAAILQLAMLIQTATPIESDKAKAKFLPYQIEWIDDDSPMRLGEKSIRIGWTYGDAFKNVRKRLRHNDRDYLFGTKDELSAVEYMQLCVKFCDIYKVAKTIISRGEESMKVPVLKDNQDTGFTTEIKVRYIRFDTGSRILAFTSNVNAMIVFGGDVGLDEFPAHPKQQELWETAAGRTTMGYDIGVWGAHKGSDTLFYQFAREARSGKGGWSYHRVTMEDAIDQGYLNLIFQRTGKRFTKEEFLASCRQRARLEEVYQQAYCCNPSGGTAAAMPWSTIELCAKDYADYEREDLEAEEITALFGKFREATKLERETAIRTWLDGKFGGARARHARHCWGFDVAASGKGDLCSMYLDEKVGGVLRMRALLTMRTDDWHFIETCATWFMESITDISGCGDETGLGRQICWTLAQKFPGRFEGVNFSGEKHDMGFALVAQMTTAEKIFPAAEKDLAEDYFALRKEFKGKTWHFSEAGNSLNDASHCDMAWSGALATRAGLLNAGTTAYTPVRPSALGTGFGDFEQDEDTGLWLPN